MKQYIFTETGEFRKAKPKEYYFSNNNCGKNDFPSESSSNYVILKLEIKEYWKPKTGDRYWFILENEILSQLWNNDICDKVLFDNGNCFATEIEVKNRT
jgi:hypothetical protein